MSSTTPSTDQTTTAKLNNAGKPLPSIAMKWGRTPNKSQTETSDSSDLSKPSKPDFTTFYTPEEQEALRAKGINPTLKAEMEWSKAQSQGKGSWGKVAGTAMGGGWIK